MRHVFIDRLYRLGLTNMPYSFINFKINRSYVTGQLFSPLSTNWSGGMCHLYRDYNM